MFLLLTVTLAVATGASPPFDEGHYYTPTNASIFLEWRSRPHDELLRPEESTLAEMEEAFLSTRVLTELEIGSLPVRSQIVRALLSMVILDDMDLLDGLYNTINAVVEVSGVPVQKDQTPFVHGLSFALAAPRSPIVWNTFKIIAEEGYMMYKDEAIGAVELAQAVGRYAAIGYFAWFSAAFDPLQARARSIIPIPVDRRRSPYI